MQLDAILIGTDDIARALRDYTLLLGVEPRPLANGGWRFPLTRGAVEIAPGRPGLDALRFLVAGKPANPESFHGIRVVLDDAPREASVDPGPLAQASDRVDAIDHVVVRTQDADRAIALWRDRVGLRLALDRDFEVRGVRLVFFRSGGITLEYASFHGQTSDGDADDELFGASYRVADLETRRARLLAEGFEVSEIRPGMKPGTMVATVRSRTEGVATLLLAASSEA
jgi:catechol 2,3-dioxygenase-like lactoylglutathione lyase family enzyme